MEGKGKAYDYRGTDKRTGTKKGQSRFSETRSRAHPPPSKGRRWTFQATRSSFRFVSGPCRPHPVGRRSRRSLPRLSKELVPSIVACPRNEIVLHSPPFGDVIRNDPQPTRRCRVHRFLRRRRRRLCKRQWRVQRREKRREERRRRRRNRWSPVERSRIGDSGRSQDRIEYGHVRNWINFIERRGNGPGAGRIDDRRPALTDNGSDSAGIGPDQIGNRPLVDLRQDRVRHGHSDHGHLSEPEHESGQRRKTEESALGTVDGYPRRRQGGDHATHGPDDVELCVQESASPVARNVRQFAPVERSTGIDPHDTDVLREPLCHHALFWMPVTILPSFLSFPAFVALLSFFPTFFSCKFKAQSWRIE